jgi:CubicO group peptidase (beta-lactamase class C family)
MLACAGLVLLLAAAPESQPLDVARTVTAEMAAAGVPGAQVCVVRNGAIEFNAGFGFSDVEAKIPMTSRTLMLLASDSKMFTGLALQLLAAKGTVSLTAPISRYDAELPPALGRVTLLQLMSHTAGIKDHAEDFGHHDDDALGNAVAASSASLLFTEPGEIFSYSNLGFDLAGYLLERVSGKPFPDALDQLVFAPAGMTDTTARLTTAITFPFAKGYRKGRSGLPELVRPFPDNAAQRPSGGVFSTATDLCRFVQIIMNDGRAGGVRVFPAAAVRAFLSPQAVSEPFGGERPSRYGSGLNFVDVGGRELAQHAGSIAGFGALVRFEPRTKFAVVILANATSGLLLGTFRAVTRSILGLAPASVPSPQPIAMTAPEQESYAGRYVNDPKYLAIDITVHAGTLFLQQVGSADPPTVVTKVGPGQFVSDGEPFAIVADRTGTPKYLVIVSHALLKQREPPAR